MVKEDSLEQKINAEFSIAKNIVVKATKQRERNVLISNMFDIDKHWEFKLEKRCKISCLISEENFLKLLLNAKIQNTGCPSEKNMQVKIGKLKMEVHPSGQCLQIGNYHLIFNTNFHRVIGEEVFEMTTIPKFDKGNQFK